MLAKARLGAGAGGDMAPALCTPSLGGQSLEGGSAPLTWAPHSTLPHTSAQHRGPRVEVRALRALTSVCRFMCSRRVNFLPQISQG